MSALLNILKFAISMTLLIAMLLPLPALASNTLSTAQSLYDAAKFAKAEELLVKNVHKESSAASKAKMFLLLGVIKYQQDRKQSAEYYFNLALQSNPAASLPQPKYVDKGVLTLFADIRQKGGYSAKSSKAVATSKPAPSAKSAPSKTANAKPIVAASKKSFANAKTPTMAAKPLVRKPPPAPAKPPAPLKTLLIVNSNIKDASVSIDGIIVGKVGVPLEVRPGSFNIEIFADGHLPQKTAVNIRDKQTLTVQVNLQKNIPKPVAPPVVAQVPSKNPPIKAGSAAKVAAPANTGAKLAQKPKKAAKAVDPFAETAPKIKPPTPDSSALAAEFARDAATGGAPPQMPPPVQTNPYAGAQPAYQQPVYPVAPAYPPQYPYPAPQYQQAPVYQQAPQYYPPPAPPAYVQQPPVQQDLGIPPPPPNIAQPQQPPEGTGVNDNDIGSLYRNGKPRRQVAKKGPETNHLLNLAPFGIAQYVRGQTMLGTLFAAGQGGTLLFYFLTNNTLATETATFNSDVDNFQQVVDSKTNDAEKADAQKELDAYISQTNVYLADLQQQADYSLYGFIGLWGANIVANYMYSPPRQIGYLEQPSLILQPQLYGSAFGWQQPFTFGQQDFSLQSKLYVPYSLLNSGLDLPHPSHRPVQLLFGLNMPL